MKGLEVYRHYCQHKIAVSAKKVIVKCLFLAETYASPSLSTVQTNVYDHIMLVYLF